MRRIVLAIVVADCGLCYTFRLNAFVEYLNRVDCSRRGLLLYDIQIVKSIFHNLVVLCLFGPLLVSKNSYFELISS